MGWRDWSILSDRSSPGFYSTRWPFAKLEEALGWSAPRPGWSAAALSLTVAVAVSVVVFWWWSTSRVAASRRQRQWLCRFRIRELVLSVSRLLVRCVWSAWERVTMTDSRVQRLNEINRRVRDHFKHALDCDQEGIFAEAIEHYNKSVTGYNEALAIQFGSGAQWDKEKKLQVKMRKTRDEVVRHVAELHRKVADQDGNTNQSAASPSLEGLDMPKGFFKIPGARGLGAGSAGAGRNRHRLRSDSVSKESGRQSSRNEAADKGGKATASKANKIVLGAEQEKQLRAIDKKLRDQIMNEVVQDCVNVTFEDVIGLEGAKQALQEIVILPSLRPELFTGLRAPARGLLLFGPPGNGKTMLAKALANESKCTFFAISASTLTSKWLGESEKLVRALFLIARAVQPAIIFIDEVDSILTKRGEGEQEASRRLKTELLIQFDGVVGAGATRVLVMGATNLPHEIDEAGLRRFTKRIMIPMPGGPARVALLKHMLHGTPDALSESDYATIAKKTQGYSNSDLAALARDAALGPIRDLGTRVRDVSSDKVRSITKADFIGALANIRPSTTAESIRAFEEWAAEYGAVA